MAKAMAAVASDLLAASDAGRQDVEQREVCTQGKVKKPRPATLQSLLNHIRPYNKVFKDELTSMDVHIFIDGCIRMPVQQDGFRLFRAFLLAVDECKLTREGLTDVTDPCAALEDAVKRHIWANFAKYKGYCWIPDGPGQALAFAEAVVQVCQVGLLNSDLGDLVSGILGDIFDANVYMFEGDELHPVTEERDEEAPARRDIFLARTHPGPDVHYYWASAEALQRQLSWEDTRTKVKAKYNAGQLDNRSLILRETWAPKGQEQRYLVST